MDHNNSQILHTSRHASRRRHRRLGSAVVAACSSNSAAFYGSAAAVQSLPRSVVREAGMFELLAAEMRIAELEQALAEARDIACTDPLTGALNRRGFDKAYSRELARARRSGVPFALAHIDLDDFKQVNDTLGHQAGDRALMHLVASIQRSMRPSDVLCRFGGEEFILMLPETDLNSASAAISRFLGEFSQSAIPGTDCAMTFSAGVVVQSLDESLDDAIRRADSATYVAKHSGKNRVVTC